MILIFLTRQEAKLHKIQKRRTGVPIDGRESKRQLGVGGKFDERHGWFDG
jgi:hypothetical protein